MGLGKLFRIVGAVNEGVSWISAGLDSVSAWQGLTQFKKQFPHDYRYFDELGNIALNSKFDFKLSPSFPGYVASSWLKSWTSAAKLPMVMLLDPIQKTVEVSYAPVEAVFVQKDARMMRLLNWVNERLMVGRFQVQCTTKSMIRSDLMQLAYHQTLHYPHLKPDQFRGLVGNMLSQATSFYTRYVPIIQALAEQKLDLALSVADRIYVLEQGKVVYEGEPESLRSQPHLLQQMMAIYGSASRPQGQSA